ncbi:MAG: hypothetical protein WAO91_04545 [Candidatus Nitrosotenuis sp.]
MNQQEQLILKVLSSVDVVKGKTKFVKILHLVCKLLEVNKKESPFTFKPNKFGFYPPDLEPVLERLENEKYVQVNSNFFSKREDLSLINPFNDYTGVVLEESTNIETLVQTLNPYSSDEVIAISYHLFPESSVKSEIRPQINKKITELFSPLSLEFEEADQEKPIAESISNNVKALYPQFNDLDARLQIMKSIGLNKLPPIIPSMIDDSTGFLAKKYPIFKKYNLEEMLEDARRR